VLGHPGRPPENGERHFGDVYFSLARAIRVNLAGLSSGVLAELTVTRTHPVDVSGTLVGLSLVLLAAPLRCIGPEEELRQRLAGACLEWLDLPREGNQGHVIQLAGPSRGMLAVPREVRGGALRHAQSGLQGGYILTDELYGGMSPRGQFLVLEVPPLRQRRVYSSMDHTQLGINWGRPHARGGVASSEPSCGTSCEDGRARAAGGPRRRGEGSAPGKD